MPLEVTAVRILLERLEKLLGMSIAFERGEVMVRYAGSSEPLTPAPRATARLQALQRRQRLQRQRTAPAPKRVEVVRPRGRRESRTASPTRRQRATSATRRGPPSDPSSGSGGDEPPLDGVTVSRGCSGCGAPLAGRRSHAAYCSNACRQKAYRRRQAPESVTLTPALRAWLRAEIDRRTRERLKGEREQLREEWELAA